MSKQEFKKGDTVFFMLRGTPRCGKIIGLLRPVYTRDWKPISRFVVKDGSFKRTLHEEAIQSMPFQKKEKPSPYGVCPECYKEFTKRIPRQVCCSVVCGRRRSDRTKEVKHITKGCKNCGKEMVVLASKLAAGKGVYCGVECARARWRKTK